jgi:signal transduction histidine kinase
VVVTTKKELGFLELHIDDDGIGMPEKSEAQMGYHYGLLSMKERAAMIGADLNITSEPGKGTSVTVKLKFE